MLGAAVPALPSLGYRLRLSFFTFVFFILNVRNSGFPDPARPSGGGRGYNPPKWCKKLHHTNLVGIRSGNPETNLC